MANEKTYTAKEAAFAVLKKAEEVLKKSELVKGEKGVHLPVHDTHRGGIGRSAVGMDVRSGLGSAAGNKAAHQGKLNELKNMPKPNLTKDEDGNKAAPSKPPEAHEQNATPPDGVKSQPGPESDPRGSNQQPGTVPPMAYGNGIHKLAHFMGHMSTKKKKPQV